MEAQHSQSEGQDDTRAAEHQHALHDWILPVGRSPHAPDHRDLGARDRSLQVCQTVEPSSHLHAQRPDLHLRSTQRLPYLWPHQRQHHRQATIEQERDVRLDQHGIPPDGCGRDQTNEASDQALRHATQEVGSEERACGRRGRFE